MSLVETLSLAQVDQNQNDLFRRSLLRGIFVGVADSGYDSSIMRLSKPLVGAIHELPLPKLRVGCVIPEGNAPSQV